MVDDVGKVIGTSRDSRPLEFWVGVNKNRSLQLDDVVAVKTCLPDSRAVTLYGIIDDVRSSYEGSKFDSDVFLVGQGILPVNVSTIAHAAVTRVQDDDGKEVFVPPMPGEQVDLAQGVVRERALFFDTMQRRFPVGLSRDGQVLWGNLAFLDGSQGAHVSISGVSGVATKTSYALFLLYSLFYSGSLGKDQINSKAIVFNVKGRDLMFLDKPNAKLGKEEADKYGELGLPAGPFQDVSFWSPVKKDSVEPIPELVGVRDDIVSYFWSLREFCQDRLLRFLFTEADSETSQVAYAVGVAERYLYAETQGQKEEGWVTIDGHRLTQFDDLVDLMNDKRDDIFEPSRVASPTVDAFLRRLQGAAAAMGHLVRKTDGKIEEERHRIDWRKGRLNVIDIQPLPDRGKRFVVGVILKRLMLEKESSGESRPLVFIVLDELNKYAPRDGYSPIKELVLDIAERGRSLGVVLVGAQQTASEVESRVSSMASFRVVGRLDSAESSRSEYGFLTEVARARSRILTPGRLFLYQPDIPTPLFVEFPHPGWATRQEEVGVGADRVPRIFER